MPRFKNGLEQCPFTNGLEQFSELKNGLTMYHRNNYITHDVTYFWAWRIKIITLKTSHNFQVMSTGSRAAEMFTGSGAAELIQIPSLRLQGHRLWAGGYWLNLSGFLSAPRKVCNMPRSSTAGWDRTFLMCNGDNILTFQNFVGFWSSFFFFFPVLTFILLKLLMFKTVQELLGHSEQYTTGFFFQT